MLRFVFILTVVSY